MLLNSPVKTTLSAYAEKLLSKVGSAPVPPEIAFDPKEWIGTGAAAKLTGYSQRRIHALCDEGFFIPGNDWKQRPAMNGKRSAGRIFIRRAALEKLEGC